MINANFIKIEFEEIFTEALVKQTAIILRKMVVGACRDGYRNQLFNVAEDAMNKRNCVDLGGNEKPFSWCTKESTILGCSNFEYT